MRYPACEKLEIIRLVEQSHLPVRRTLDKIGIPRPTFYRWYDLYRCGGPGALEDARPGPDRVDLHLGGGGSRHAGYVCARPSRCQLQIPIADGAGHTFFD